MLFLGFERRELVCLQKLDHQADHLGVAAGACLVQAVVQDFAGFPAVITLVAGMQSRTFRGFWRADGSCLRLMAVLLFW